MTTWKTLQMRFLCSDARTQEQVLPNRRHAQSSSISKIDPAVAAAEFRNSQLRDANRISQSDSRARVAEAAAAPDPVAANSAFRAQRPRAQTRATNAALDVRLNNLLDADVFEEDDLELIESNFERHPAAALAMFCSNTTVAFGYRSVDMDAQVHL